MEVIINCPKKEVKIDAKQKDIEFSSTYSVYIEGEIYDGDYEVTPKVDAQSLPTATKVMLQDVQIKKIPYFETSNEYGNTIYIGSEV